MIDVYRTTPRDLANLAREKGRMGYVAASEGKTAGQLHYTKSGQVGNKWNQKVPGETRKVEERLLQQLLNVPKARRRSHQERFRALFDRLAQTALDSYRRVGYVAWPTSIQTELKTLAWKTGDPTLADYGGLDHVYKQVEALTRHYTVRGANKQKEKDQHKVALDWHGHTAA